MAMCEKCKSTNLIESANGNYCCNCGWDSTKKDYIKRQTNADKIRAMNDSELADFLYCIEAYCDDGEYKKYIDEVTLNDSMDDILQWLQSEAE